MINPPPPETTTWADWGLSALSGTVGALVGFLGLYLVFLLTRRADRGKQAAIDAATERRRLLEYRVGAVIGLSEAMKDNSQDWHAAPSVKLREWIRRTQLPLGMAFEFFGVRMIVDAPEMSLLVRDEAQKMYVFRASSPSDVADFEKRVDGLYEWILRWAADPSIVEERPSFF